MEKLNLSEPIRHSYITLAATGDIPEFERDSSMEHIDYPPRTFSGYQASLALSRDINIPEDEFPWLESEEAYMLMNKGLVLTNRARALSDGLYELRVCMENPDARQREGFYGRAILSLDKVTDFVSTNFWNASADDEGGKAQVALMGTRLLSANWKTHGEEAGVSVYVPNDLTVLKDLGFRFEVLQTPEGGGVIL